MTRLNMCFYIREINNGVVFTYNSGETSDEMYYENMDELYEAVPALVVRAVEISRKYERERPYYGSTAQAGALGQPLTQAPAEEDYVPTPHPEPMGFYSGYDKLELR